MSETLRRGEYHPMSVWISCWLLILTAVTMAGCSSDATDPVPYSGRWEYRWGDSPHGASGELLWAGERVVEGRQDPSWRPFALPGSPAGRGDHNSLWLRTQLTGPQAHEPTLFLLVVDQILEAYLDGRPVYRFGVLDGPGADRFQGYRPHFIPLGSGYQGKTLALRIHSRHANIGVAGSVQIGDRLALTIALMRRGQDKLFVGGLLLVLGLAALGLYVVRRSERIYRADPFRALSQHRSQPAAHVAGACTGAWKVLTERSTADSDFRNFLTARTISETWVDQAFNQSRVAPAVLSRFPLARSRRPGLLLRSRPLRSSPRSCRRRCAPWARSLPSPRPEVPRPRSRPRPSSRSAR